MNLKANNLVDVVLLNRVKAKVEVTVVAVMGLILFELVNLQWNRMYNIVNGGKVIHIRVS